MSYFSAFEFGFLSIECLDGAYYWSVYFTSAVPIFLSAFNWIVYLLRLGEDALLGDIRIAPDICGSTWDQAGIVGEFAVQHPSGRLVGVRLRPDKKHGNGPQTVQDVRRSAAMGLKDAFALAQWLHN